MLSKFLKKQTVSGPKVKDTPGRQEFITFRINFDIIDISWQVTLGKLNAQTFSPRDKCLHYTTSKPENSSKHTENTDKCKRDMVYLLF